VEIAAPRPEDREALRPHLECIQVLVGAEVGVTGEPRRGTAGAAGRYVVVRPGKLIHPEGESPAAAWYREIHPLGPATAAV